MSWRTSHTAHHWGEAALHGEGERTLQKVQVMFVGNAFAVWVFTSHPSVFFSNENNVHRRFPPCENYFAVIEMLS